MDDADLLLHWFDYHHRGRVIPVSFGIESEHDYLRNAHGVAFGPPSSCVVLNVANTKVETTETLIHELVHVLLWDNYRLHRRGESVCRRVEALVPMLTKCGFVPPAYPAKHAAMRRRAMRLAKSSKQ